MFQINVQCTCIHSARRAHKYIFLQRVYKSAEHRVPFLGQPYADSNGVKILSEQIE